jgi:hypothetical protein
MWDNSIFEVNTIEFRGQWICLYGTHVNSFFKCMVVGVYTVTCVQELAKL